MAWLNVDKITKTATVHRDNCAWVKPDTKHQKNGEWHYCVTEDETFESAQGLSGYNVKGCGHCMRY